MRVVTLKLRDGLATRLESVVRRRGISKSEWLRQAIEARLAEEGRLESVLEGAWDLAGCIKGRPRDLSSNPKHLRAFGR
jgi:predicted transcriptional regulator